MSPESDARKRGQHYMVKELRYGFECLICGLLGDISWIRSSPCKPKEVVSPTTTEEVRDLEAVEEEKRKAQEEFDRKMAKELHTLQLEEAELQQRLLLQQLEHEEDMLALLLAQQMEREVQKKEVELAEKIAREAAGTKENSVALSTSNPRKCGTLCLSQPNPEGSCGYIDLFDGYN